MFSCLQRLLRHGQIESLTQIALILGLSSFGWVFWGLTERTIAAEPKQDIALKDVPLPDPEPLDLSLLQPGNIPASAVTATTISTTGLTIPSLWWAKDQYAAKEPFGRRLIENWIAFPTQNEQVGRVDFVVNRQVWSLLDYLQRYSFIQEFGAVASSYGYNIRIFDSQANLLAAYTCDFSPLQSSSLQRYSPPEPSTVPVDSKSPIFSSYTQPSTESPTCASFLDNGGKASLRGRSTQPGEGLSNTSGIVQP